MTPLTTTTILAALVFPTLASAMPDWDGTYICSTNSKDRRYVTFKTDDEKLHLIGFESRLESISDGLDCVNETFEPKSSTGAGIRMESTCSEQELTESLTFAVGQAKLMIKVAVTKIDSNKVTLSVRRDEDSPDKKLDLEIIYHCEK